MKTSGFYLLAAVAILAIGGFATGSIAQGQEQTEGRQELTAVEVLDRVRQAILPFRSIEYRYEWESVGVRRGATSNKSRYSNSGEFAYSDGKFLSDYFVAIEEDKYHAYAAFDGELYQSARDDLSRVAVNAQIWLHTPYGAIQPIMGAVPVF